MAQVSETHDDYDEFEAVWETMRHHLSGSRAIKKEKTRYLPMLGDENDREDVEDYNGYLRRALYYEATKKTQQAMLGALLLKPPVFNNLDEQYTDQFAQVTLDGFSMQTFMRNVLSELVGVSRTGVLVERAKEEDGGHLYFVQYRAEDILNWRYERIADKIVLTLLVLRERDTRPEGRFGTEEITRYRVLELVEGIYIQQVFEETISNDTSSLVELDPVIPTNVGQPWNEIPFVFFTPLGNVPEVCEPVLSSIAEINESHYMTSADLEHGRHFTGLPTAWVAGFDTEQKLKVGSQIAWITERSDARAGFLEFTGAGLTTLQAALAEKQEQMATMGARMLRPPKTGIEAAETARIYQSAESSSLADIARAASESFTDLIHYWLNWQGVDEPDVTVDLNTDYVDTRLDSATITTMVSAWLGGAISHETLFYNLKQGEIIPDGVTFEDEQGRIEANPPPLGAAPDDSGAE